MGPEPRWSRLQSRLREASGKTTCLKLTSKLNGSEFRANGSAQASFSKSSIFVARGAKRAALPPRAPSTLFCRRLNRDRTGAAKNEVLPREPREFIASDRLVVVVTRTAPVEHLRFLLGLGQNVADPVAVTAL